MNVELYSEGNDFGKKLTKVEIINETVAFYSADTTRRSIGVYKEYGSACLYAGPDGKKCAYSRCWKEGVYDPTFESETAITLGNPDELVEERYKGHSAQFWSSIQRLHDKEENWITNGLSEEGESCVRYLLEKFKD